MDRNGEFDGKSEGMNELVAPSFSLHINRTDIYINFLEFDTRNTGKGCHII